MELLIVRGLRKRLNDDMLLDIEYLRIEQGSAYVLSGANGAGKSTLLRILSGLEPAELGTVSFLGRETAFSPYPRELRKFIIYVHQHPIMFNTSVEANIAYGLKAAGLTRSDIKNQVDAALNWAKLSHLAKQNAEKLSGGEKQRVALARAKILNPRLLLLDEPTSNLDTEAREQVVELIPTLLTAGRSVVIASHDPDLLAIPTIKRLTLQNGKLTDPSAVSPAL